MLVIAILGRLFLLRGGEGSIATVVIVVMHVPNGSVSRRGGHSGNVPAVGFGHGVLYELDGSG